MKYTLFLLLSAAFLSSPESFAGILILNGLSHEKTVNPGETYRDVIDIQNGSNEPETVVIYQRDYRFNFSGESFYDEPDSQVRSNATWIEINQTYITLQPNEKISVGYQVSVPENDSLRGTYWSVIMVESVVPPDPNTQQDVFQIKSIVRYAIQIITQTGSTGSRELKFLGTDLVTQDTLLIFNVVVENTGERMLQHIAQLELYDDQGNPAGVYKSEMTRTYPGTSVNCPIDLSDALPGTYSALLVTECEEGDIIGTNITLDISNSAVKSIRLQEK
ncbi:MAG: hypothetical protein PHD61_05845 [Bacteroidales bacterium]|nr:hypothetical protein [Bacteroidales bacterium]